LALDIDNFCGFTNFNNKESKPQAITSARSATVTIISGGNATGNHIPPYYIFPGQRWNDAFLNIFLEFTERQLWPST
jgi:hypothetical protein